MLRPGSYPAVVIPVSTEHGEVACQFGKSKNKGTPQVVVAFEILRGPDAGQTISWFGYFSDNVTATDRTFAALRACGFTGDDLERFPDQRPTNEVEIVVGHEEYEGKMQAKVQWVNAPGRGVKLADPMRGQDLRMFAGRFKSKLKNIPEIKTVEAKREPPSAAPPPEDAWSGNDSLPPPSDDEFRSSSQSKHDDDIPF